MSRAQCGCIYATSQNTKSVRDGYEMGGYVKTFCDRHKVEGWEYAEESLALREGRQRLFDLIESMTGFTCLEDDMSEIEQVVLSYASESKS